MDQSWSKVISKYLLNSGFQLDRNEENCLLLELTFVVWKEEAEDQMLHESLSSDSRNTEWSQTLRGIRVPPPLHYMCQWNGKREAESDCGHVERKGQENYLH